MKLLATESKNGSPTEKKSPRSTSANVSKAKSSIQAPEKQLADSLASAPKKEHAEKDASRKANRKRKDPQIRQAAKANRSTKRTNPVLNIPFVKDSKAARVTFTLLLVRPWVLVAGFWLFSLMGSAVAIKGLIRPTILTKALPEAIVEAPPVATSSIINVVEDSNVEDSNEASETTANSASRENIQAPETTVEPVSKGGFPVGIAVALAGTCAAGCLAMSRRRAMARLSVARSQQRTRRKPVRPDAARPIKTAQHLKQVRKPATAETSSRERKRNLRPVAAAVTHAEVKGDNRAKKRRQRNKRLVGASGTQNLAMKGTRTGQAPSRKTGQQANQPAQRSRVLPSRSTAQHNLVETHPARSRRVRRPSSRMARRQSVVSVVPANESHALDWTDGSLAHQMDMRHQPRAASM